MLSFIIKLIKKPDRTAVVIDIFIPILWYFFLNSEYYLAAWMFLGIVVILRVIVTILG